MQAGLYGVPTRQRRTMEILTAMGLDDKADAYARCRAVCVAAYWFAALVHNPPVLVLDEPTAGVDIELRKQLWDYVVELNRQGVTIVLTTHYLEEAQNYATALRLSMKARWRRVTRRKICCGD